MVFTKIESHRGVRPSTLSEFRPFSVIDVGSKAQLPVVAFNGRNGKLSLSTTLRRLLNSEYAYFAHDGGSKIAIVPCVKETISARNFKASTINAGKELKEYIAAMPNLNVEHYTYKFAFERVDDVDGFYLVADLSKPIETKAIRGKQ